MQSIEQLIAQEINAQPRQVAATVALLDEGATVPFIARYRKEVTGGLDDTQLRTLEERLRYLRELEERRETILKSIAEQEKLTPELEKAIQEADTKTRLEDLYLPYKPKRRTRAQIAREAGLEPLADALLDDPTRDPEQTAAGYLNEEHKIATAKDALDGAKQILMERFAENAELLTRLRTFLWEKAHVQAKLADGKEEEGAKFRDYFEHQEALKNIPSHRALALFRGRNEGVLHVSMVLPEELESAQPHPCEAMVTEVAGWRHEGRAADDWLGEVMRWTWKIKLNTHLETELLGRVREMAEEEAIQVFARNLKSLLMASPAGPKATMGLDPGLRTGVKVVVVDPTGKLLEHTTIFPHQPKKQWDQSLATLAKLCAKHDVSLIAIGNGTASRETDKLAGEVVKQLSDRNIQKIMVSEAGASVYSASEMAAREFPDLDVSFRGAVSIARRLQDPLAELVKIEPQSIGVGQYQHDVDQRRLTKALEAVVEDAVNAVGVDLNTASAPLLSHVAGLGPKLAQAVVDHRDASGAFGSRKALLKVAGLGPKAFEQAAGFLRIRDGEEPLDASSVHPEAYGVARRIVSACGRDIRQIMGQPEALKGLRAEDFVDASFGLPTVKDILAELEKPGRDPRPSFRTAQFADGVEDIKDLKPGMRLEGTVTNVAAFGAFVDVGVHQDGLVHISQLADRFVKDPHEVVKAGDVVSVTVTEVDVPRKRIGLSMRKDGGASAKAARDERGPSPDKGKPRGGGGGQGRGKPAQPRKDEGGGALGAALRDAMNRK